MNKTSAIWPLLKAFDGVDEKYRTFIKEIELESDRGAGLYGSSYLEKELGLLLSKTLILGHDKEVNLVIEKGAFGSFDNKIKMAFLLGLITNEAKEALYVIKNIRNRFAHDDGHRDFTSPEVIHEIKKLKVYATDFDFVEDITGNKIAFRYAYTEAVFILIMSFRLRAQQIKQPDEFKESTASVGY